MLMYCFRCWFWFRDFTSSFRFSFFCCETSEFKSFSVCMNHRCLWTTSNWILEPNPATKSTVGTCDTRLKLQRVRAYILSLVDILNDAINCAFRHQLNSLHRVLFCTPCSFRLNDLLYFVISHLNILVPDDILHFHPGEKKIRQRGQPL